MPGQLLQIAQLRSAVAFPERMHIVDVAHDGTDGLREGGSGEAAQEVGLGQAPVDVGHAGADETAELELMAAFGDFYGSEFARPGVDVLEEVVVNGAEMGEVEVARRDALSGPLDNPLPLLVTERNGVGQVQFVAEDGATRIAV